MFLKLLPLAFYTNMNENRYLNFSFTSPGLPVSTAAQQLSALCVDELSTAHSHSNINTNTKIIFSYHCFHSVVFDKMLLKSLSTNYSLQFGS